jgi:hypothetical protein
MQRLWQTKPSAYLQTLNQHIAPWAALLFYGLWAAYICYQQSLEHWYVNAAIHGVYAFALTIMSRKITLFFKHFLLQNFSSPPLSASVITYIVMTAMLIILPTAIQLQLQNNSVLMTIMPGIVAGQFYLITVLYEQ